MSKYTTGEIAKLCGVTVRTVQYYDKRGILNPSCGHKGFCVEIARTKENN